MTSSDYLHPPRAKRSRTGLLCLACLIVGMLAGGLVVWATRPADDAIQIAAGGGADGAVADPTIVTTTTGAVTTTTSTALVPPADFVQSCNAPESPRPAVATIAEFRALIVRTWMLCSATSVFGSRDEKGMELLPDGSWFKLYADNEGTLTRGEGFGRRGTWEIIDTSGMSQRATFQVNLSIFGSGTVMTSPVFTAEPTKMRMNNMGLHIADYVAVEKARP